MEKLSTEDKIMGRTKPLPKTELELKAFTKNIKYKVNSVGNHNPSIISGDKLADILPNPHREKILNGDLMVKYAGLEIERIIEEQPKPKTTKKRDK